MLVQQCHDGLDFVELWSPGNRTALSVPLDIPGVGKPWQVGMMERCANRFGIRIDVETLVEIVSVLAWPRIGLRKQTQYVATIPITKRLEYQVVLVSLGLSGL
uniref:hypothetical protein n=1 Tax=Halodesulfurarchaeum formicicum TaxID=1873524 RepID=UPI000AE6B8E5|nr:hypothetical protein [Halodesulfurarchaeum formicicum]